MLLQLFNLVQVSNNSRLTQEVLKMLNEKLTPEERKIFYEWLKLIKK